MVNHAASINIRERFERHAMTLFLLIDPGGESLLHDPPPRTLQPRRHRVDFVSQRQRYMRRQNFGFD